MNQTTVIDTMCIKGIKPMARIKICNAIIFTFYDDVEGFVFPNELQKKNLKENFCIEIEDLREDDAK